MSKAAGYKRVVLKLSGESFCKPGRFGIDFEAISTVVDQLLGIIQMGVQMGVVVGGGNFIRGRDLERLGEQGQTGTVSIHRATADYMGMLATIINALALQDALESRGATTRVQSAIAIPDVCEPFVSRRAVRHLGKGRTVLFAGGTGNPFFTTDTCAALRARQINAEVLLKATKVDGVFDSDPEKNPDAKKYDRLSYEKVLADKLGIMDLTAISMCMENDIPILVFQLSKEGNLADAVCGKDVGTMISK